MQRGKSERLKSRYSALLVQCMNRCEERGLNLSVLILGVHVV